MHAEDTYLFRHALLRDAAYNLQLPADRAALHLLAADKLEALYSNPFNDLQLSGVALQVADHIRFARDEYDSAELRTRETRLLRMAAEEAAANYRHIEEEDCWLRIAELTAGAERAEGLGKAGVVASRRGDMASAEQHLEAALQEAIKCDDPDALVRAYNGLAVVFRHSGKTDRAMKANEHARELLDQVADRSLHAFVYSAYGSLLMNTGRYEEADEAFRKAEIWHRNAGNELRLATCIGERARMAMHSGRFDEAAKLFEQSMDVVRSHDDEATYGRLLINLGILQAQAGRVALSESMYREALTIVKRVGDLRSEGILLGLLANLQTKRLNKEEAENLYQQALQIHCETDNLRAQGHCLGNMGSLFVTFGEIEQGERYLNQALDLHRQVQNLHGEGGHLCTLGVAYLCRAEVQLARDTWQQGIHILQSHGIAGLDPTTVQRMREECAKAGIEPFPVPASVVPERP